MQVPNHAVRTVAASALGLAMVAAMQVPTVVVDGWSLISNTKSTERGSPETTMLVQVAGAHARIDWQKAPPGTPAGSYLVITGETGQMTMVSPKEKTATILPVGGMASMLASLGAAGLMKIEVSDVTVSVAEDGAGEARLGYPIRKYTMKQAYAMKMSVGPIKRSGTVDNTTELFMAEVPVPEQRAFEAFAKNFAYSFAGLAGDGMKALIDEVIAKMPRGVTLKSVATSITDQGGRKSTSVTTTEVREFKRADVDPKVFEIPADYKVNDMSALKKNE